MVGVVAMAAKKSRAKKPSKPQVSSNVDFGREVRRRREAAQMTLEDLANRSGLSPNYIGSIEIGKRDPSLSTMDALAKALGAALGVLLGGVPEISQAAIQMGQTFDQSAPEVRQGLLLILRSTRQKDADKRAAARTNHLKNPSPSRPRPRP
jgi:transcriptional regulator with XRE-family HTH domain